MFVDSGKFSLSREARQPTKFQFCRCRWDRRTGTRLWVGSDRWGWCIRCGLFLKSLLTRPCLRWQRFPQDHQPLRPLRRKLARVESVHSSGQTTPRLSRWRTPTRPRATFLSIFRDRYTHSSGLVFTVMSLLSIFPIRTQRAMIRIENPLFHIGLACSHPHDRHHGQKRQTKHNHHNAQQRKKWRQENEQHHQGMHEPILNCRTAPV